MSYSANIVSFCTNFFLNRIFLEGFGLGSSTSFNIKTFDFIHFTTAGIPCDFWSVRAYYLNVFQVLMANKRRKPLFLFLQSM